MSTEPKLLVSRVQKVLIESLDENTSGTAAPNIDEIRKVYPDAEIVTQSEWQQYLENQLISFWAVRSSETSFNNGKAMLPKIRTEKTQNLEFFISGTPLTSDIYCVYCRYKQSFFFLHERKDVTPYQIILKIELCREKERSALLEDQVQRLKNVKPSVNIFMKNGKVEYTVQGVVDVILQSN